MQEHRSQGVQHEQPFRNTSGDDPFDSSTRPALKLLGGGTVAALAPEQLSGDNTEQNSVRRTDVVVVGAGFAGMMAARNLIRSGKKVAVLEARDRVGGRVKAGQIAGLTVDTGGTWVGPTQTRLLELIKEYGLNTTPQYITGKNIEQVG